MILELFVDEPSDPISLSVSAGIRLVVHNQTHRPDFSEGILITPGTQTFVGIGRSFSSHLEYPYSNCVHEINTNHPSKLVKSILATDYKYTQEICFMACYQVLLNNRCSCFDFGSVLPMSTFTSQNLTPCVNSSQMTCNTNV